MNEIIAMYILTYSLVITLAGSLATFFIQYDYVTLQEFLFGEGHNKQTALQKITNIVMAHFALFLMCVFFLFIFAK